MSAPIFHRGKAYRLDDFPYDPNAKPERLTGLDKLRAVRDRGVAAALFELYFVAEKNEVEQGNAMRERERSSHERDELASLRAMATSALDGAKGQWAKAAAVEWCRFCNIEPGAIAHCPRQPLEILRRTLQRIKPRDLYH
jgi:hypothetical protein